MPYITKAHRARLAYDHKASGPGELNYVLTCIALDYLERHGKSYNTINTIMGAFTCASQEFYRRVAVPYENAKCEENGDVYRG